MNQSFALLSIVFMMGFVLVFDRRHRSGYIARFCSSNLLSSKELDLLRKVIAACE